MVRFRSGTPRLRLASAVLTPRTCRLALLAALLLALTLAVPGAGAAGPAAAGPAEQPAVERAGRVVLGSASHYAPYGEGWGEAKPRAVYNGGVPSGRAYRLTWRTWGQGRSYARGLTYLYRPGGGYYAKPGRIVLRAQRLGRCDGERAYTRLFARVARRPGEAPKRRWFAWAGGGSLCS